MVERVCLDLIGRGTLKEVCSNKIFTALKRSFDKRSNVEYLLEESGLAYLLGRVHHSVGSNYLGNKLTQRLCPISSTRGTHAHCRQLQKR